MRTKEELIQALEVLKDKLKKYKEDDSGTYSFYEDLQAHLQNQKSYDKDVEMNLVKQMEKESWLYRPTNKFGKQSVTVEDAISIAEKYAKEMCEKQREICGNPPCEGDEENDEDTFVKRDYILNTPLATENKDE